MTRIRWYGPTLVLLIAVLITMVAGPSVMRQIAWAQTDARISLVRNELAQSPFLAQLSEAFRQVADVVEPSVVSIEVRSRDRGRARPEVFRNLPPELEEFFGPRLRPGPRQEQVPEELERYNAPMPYGNGSGWVYDTQGHIITNNHVIEGADEIIVRFSDGSKYEASVVGTDPNTDVAVLKVDAGNLHPAAISTEPVEQGDMVFAFGSPFRFDFSMSQGIVSAKGRQLGIIGPGGYENFIQTDAAINPGNSGGPLTNITGEVVGMNTAIASRTGVYNGLGFAIPVGMVVDVAQQIIEHGRVSRGYLGIYIEDLTPQMAATFNFEGEGVLVTDPIPGSPADEAGVQAGDIVTHVNDEPVTSADELRYKIAGFAPGTEVTLTVNREGEVLQIPVTLTELPSRGMARTGPAEGDQIDAGNSEGVELLRKIGIESVQTFTEELAGRNVDYEPGVLIEQVRPGSLAAAAGLAPGMLITRIMGEPVETAEDLVDAIEDYSDRPAVRLRVAQRDRQQRMFLHRFVLIELPQE